MLKSLLTVKCALLCIVFLTACGPKPWDEPQLHDAAMRGDLDKVKTLIKQGAEVESRNSQGATPLHWAAFKGKLEVAKYLISHGADINATTTKGATPLRLATTHKQTEMIKYLKSRGGKI